MRRTSPRRVRNAAGSRRPAARRRRLKTISTAVMGVHASIRSRPGWPAHRGPACHVRAETPLSTLPDNLDDLPLLNPPEYPNCFVCGPDNAGGPASARPPGRHRCGRPATARRPSRRATPQRFHGGLVGLLVDEMLVYAGAPHGVWGMTAKVRYWLRRPIPMDTPTSSCADGSPSAAPGASGPS